MKIGSLLVILGYTVINFPVREWGWLLLWASNDLLVTMVYQVNNSTVREWGWLLLGALNNLLVIWRFTQR